MTNRVSSSPRFAAPLNLAGKDFLDEKLLQFQGLSPIIKLF